jgi:hypothetical protein
MKTSDVIQKQIKRMWRHYAKNVKGNYYALARGTLEAIKAAEQKHDQAVARGD